MEAEEAEGLGKIRELRGGLRNEQEDFGMKERSK